MRRNGEDVARKYGALSLIGAALLSCTLSACGGGASQVREEPADTAELTDAELRKLDGELRARLERPGDDAIPVKVFFAGRPSDAVLAELLLTRVGNAVIGQVTKDTLVQIARRADVSRVTALETGYAGDAG